MKKRLLGLLLVGAMAFAILGVMIPSTQAIVTEDLTDTARYYPAETLFYASVSLEDFRTELNDLATLIQSNTQGQLFPSDFEIPPFDVIITDIVGSTIDMDNGSWLGDSLAIGVVNVDISLLVVIDITDKQTVLDNVLDTVIVTEQNGYTLLENQRSSFTEYGILTDDVLIYGDNLDILTQAFRQDPSLQENADFVQARSALSEDSYSVFAYVNTHEIVTMIIESDPSITFPEGLFQDMGVLAVAAKIADGRNVLVDLAVTTNGQTALPQTALNPDFAAYLPSYTQILIHEANLYADFNLVIAQLDALAPILQEVSALSAQQTGASFDDTLEMFDLSTLNIGGWIQHTLTPLIAGFTGLNLEHDILSWMTGDYALSMSLIRATNELGVAPDVAFVTEVTDSDAASRVVDGLIRAGELYRLGGVAGEGSLTYPDLIPTVASLLLGSHPTVFAAPETDLKIASNDDTFAVGTAPTVNFALDPSGDSLATNAVYQHAEGFFLEAPTSVIFVNAVELVNAVNFLAPFIGRTEAEQLQFALSQIESASLSIATVNNNTAVVRLAVSVAEVGTVVQPVATPAAIDLVMPDDSASAQELQSSVLSTLQQASSDDVVTTTGSSVNIPTTVLEDSVVVIGEPSAPITIVVFSDFLCGSCNQFNNDITPLVVEEFVQTGMAQFEFRAYPIFGDVSVYHGQLLECSVILGGAEAYWPAKDILFASGMSNRSISDAPILLLADGLGIDAQALQDCQPTATQQHQANHLLGGRYFITGTPAVFVRYNNGDITPLTNVPSGGITFEFLSELILAANEQ